MIIERPILKPQRSQRCAEGVEIRSQAVDQPADAVLQNLDVEVQQVAQFVSPELQIADELRAVNVREALHRLHFHDDQTFDQQIQSIAQLELDPVIVQRHRHLALVSQAGLEVQETS